MNKIQSAIAATFVTISMTTAVFAADATKPVVPAPPVVATQVPAPIAAKPVVPAPPVVAGQPSAGDAAAERRAANLRERSKKAKSGSGSVKKTVAVPTPPIVASQPAADAAKPIVPAPPVVTAQPSAADAAAKKRADRLRERNRKARALSGSGKKAVAAPETQVAGSGTAKKAEKLNQSTTKARENTKTLNSNLPKATVPAAPSTVK